MGHIGGENKKAPSGWTLGGGKFRVFRLQTCESANVARCPVFDRTVRYFGFLSGI